MSQQQPEAEASSTAAAAAQSAADAQPSVLAAQFNDASTASASTAAPPLSTAAPSSTAAAAPHTSTSSSSAAQAPDEEQATAFAAQILGALATTPLLNAHDEQEGDVEMASPTAAGTMPSEQDGDTSMQSVNLPTSPQAQRVVSRGTSEATFDSTQLQLSSSDIIAPLPSTSPFKSTSRSGGGGAQPSSPTARFHDPISARGGRSRGGRSGAALSSARSSPAPVPTLQQSTEDALPEEEWKSSAAAGEAEAEGEEEVDDGDATVDEEGGIIRCICGYDTDDGFTIQCEKCLVWQHCACFGMSQASVPDEYLCEACEPRLVNVAFAQQHQARRRDAEARKVAEVARRVSSGGAGAGGAAATTTTTGEGAQRGRKPSVSVIDTSVGAADTTSQAAQPATKTKRGKGTGNAKASRKTPALDTPTSAVARTPLATSASTAAPPSAAAAAVSTSATSTPNPAAARAEAEERAAEKAEAWHAEFTPVARNLVAEPRVLLQLAAAMAPYEAGALEALYAEPSASARGVVVPLASEELKEGLRAVGGECVPIVIEASNLTSLAHATYVKHISDAAAAAVFANVLSIVPLPSEPSRPWTASRTFSRPTMHGLFSDAPIPAGAFIAEYRGELSTSETYRRNPINQYAQLGATKPHVHLFPPPLGCAVDARRFGTESRFARSSCHPNAVVRPILFTRSSSATVGGVGGVEEELEDPFVSLGRAPTPHADEPELRFGLFALSDIPRTHEITLGWEWDDAHIVHLLPALVKDPALGLPPPPTSGAEKGQQYLANVAAAKIQASSSLSVARTTERERRTAALAALAERGDFPYTNTRFGACMNAVLAVLLGATLCACIGSAAAPTGAGSSSASTHNARKQDCAIAQMLRLAHGMTLLNVHMPGNKSQRKVRLPEFAPLVGVKRAWRALKVGNEREREREELERGLKERLELKGLNVPFRIAPGGKVGRVTEGDFLRAIAEAERAGSKSRGEVAMMQYTTDEEMDDASVASSLTEPLSGLSDVEAGEMDEDLARLLQGEQSADAQAVAEQEEEEHQGSSILPFKKRVSGTRLKATYSGGEDSDAERAGAAGRRRASRALPLPLPRSQQKARAKAALANAHAHVAPASTSRRSSSAKRTHKRAAVAATTSEEESEDESADEAPRRPSTAAAKQKRRRTSKIAEPSSPLSSALSDEEDSLSDAPTTKRKNSKTSTRLSRTDEDEEEEEEEDESDGELSEESSDGAATLKSAGGKSKKATPAPQQQQQHKGTSESLLRKRNAEALAAAKLAKARKQRKLMSLAHLGDTESSGDERKPVATSSSSAVVGGKRARSPTKQNVGKAGKSKKPRLIVSSEEESEADVDASPSTIRDRTPLTTHEAQWGSTRSPSQGKTLAQAEPVLAQAPAKAPTPPPAPKPEPPRAKLTLAEYKKRLAERRNNEASAAASEPAPSASASAGTGAGAEVQSTVSALLESLSPIKQEISRFAPPAPRPPRPLTPPRAGFPPVLAPSPAPALASAAVAAGAMHHQQQQQQQMYNPAAPSYAAVPNAGMYAPPQPAYSASLYSAAPVQSSTHTHVAPRTPPFNAAGYATPRPLVGGTPQPAAHHQAGMLHHQQQQQAQQQQQQQQQQQGAYGLPPPLELGAAVTGVSPSSWGVGPPSSLEATPQQQQAPPQVPQQPQQQQRAGFTPIRPGFRPIASTRGGAAGGMSAIRPVAPASFNPPRGPKALSNPLFAPPTPAFATPNANSMMGAGQSSARPLAPSPLDMSTLPRRTHSGSISNASAASMSPPSALGFQHHPAPPPSSNAGVGGVGASPTLRASTAVGDFSGVPKGPRVPMEEVREPRAPLPPGREASVEPGPLAIAGGGAGGVGGQGFEEQAGAPGAGPFVGAGGFRGGRGAWRPPGANTRGFVRGSGWGTRARGDHRGGGRGRGRGGWQ